MMVRQSACSRIPRLHNGRFDYILHGRNFRLHNGRGCTEESFDYMHCLCCLVEYRSATRRTLAARKFG